MYGFERVALRILLDFAPLSKKWALQTPIYIVIKISIGLTDSQSLRYFIKAQ